MGRERGPRGGVRMGCPAQRVRGGGGVGQRSRCGVAGEWGMSCPVTSSVTSSVTIHCVLSSA